MRDETHMRDMSRQVCVSIGDVAYVTLTQGKVATIDLEDVPDVMRHHWYANFQHTEWFAVANICGKAIKMHRFLLNPPRDKEIDHKNHDSLDNRRDNIRICTRQENMRNGKKRQGCSSKYKGLYWRDREGRWEVGIEVNGKRIYLGSFNDDKEAARAYNAAAKQYFGEFALLNEGVGDEVPRKQEGDLF